MKLLIVCIVLLFFLAGCSSDYKAKVESNTSWSGFFSDRTVDGKGTTTIDLPDEETVCCTVQKQTESGYLRVTIVDDNTFSLSAGEVNSSETSAKYGVVSVCNK